MMRSSLVVMKKLGLYIVVGWLIGLAACQPGKPEVDEQKDVTPSIYPDYTEVTIPVNIAPLNFGLSDEVEAAVAAFAGQEDSFRVEMKEKTFQIPASKWKKLLQQSAGSSFQVTVMVKKDGRWTGYKPFRMYVAPEAVDPYLAYRKIAPGYELWKTMGIYQRHIETFDESPILENRQTQQNCMNCHSFCNRQADRFLFHMRQKLGGTYLVKDGKVEKLNTETPETISALVYPSWHPGGRFVAFSTNVTKQFFHPNNRNRIEVYDEKSDVVVYDTEKHELITAPALFSKQAFETFPTFSPDGKTLYFCTAEAKPMPDAYQEVKYSLCSIAFDPEKRTFGNRVDTLYAAEQQGKSVSFPRVSPDGRYLLYTLSGYGNFSIWHKDADLYWVDLKTGEHRCLEEVNSPDVESYHSWSGNSHWFVFSSRRDDGLYTRPYFAYVSAEGKVGKPFMLPQRTSDYYEDCMWSYNIPEFVSDKIDVSARAIMDEAGTSGVGIRFVK